jgi:hypothetical protein
VVVTPAPARVTVPGERVNEAALPRPPRAAGWASEQEVEVVVKEDRRPAGVARRGRRMLERLVAARARAALLPYDAAAGQNVATRRRRRRALR